MPIDTNQHTHTPKNTHDHSSVVYQQLGKTSQIRTNEKKKPQHNKQIVANKSI